MTFIPWQKDHWFSTQGNYLRYDKLEHFLLALGGTWVGAFVSLHWAALIVAFLGLAWEVKDGYVSHGFSWKDLIADMAGIGAAVLFWLL